MYKSNYQCAKHIEMYIEEIFQKHVFRQKAIETCLRYNLHYRNKCVCNIKNNLLNTYDFI